MAENNHPLAKWRAENSVTQEVLAKALDVAPLTVWRWENGARTPRRKDIKRIAEYTGLDASQIVHLEGVQ